MMLASLRTGISIWSGTSGRVTKLKGKLVYVTKRSIQSFLYRKNLCDRLPEMSLAITNTDDVLPTNADRTFPIHQIKLILSFGY